MTNIPFLSLLFALLLVTLTLIMFIKKAPKRAPKLPPSPWKLPLIGNIHNLIGALPHHALTKLSRKYGPIMHLKLGEVDHIVISSPESAREILKTLDIHFLSRPQLMASTIIFNNQNIGFSPYWRQLRKICVLELLSPSKVKSFRTIRETENSALVKSLSISAKSPVNLTEKLTLLSFGTISRVSLGSECKHGPKINTEIKKILHLLSGFEIADLFPSLSFLGSLLGTSATIKRIRSEIDVILDEIIEEHKVRKSTQEYAKEEDLIDVLLRIKDQGGLDFPFSMAHVKAVVLDMFTAGIETITSTLVWVMVELMRHPEAMKKAQDELWRAADGKGRIEESDVEELPYMNLVIKETLRLHTPAPLLVPRVNQERCIVGDFEIPEGTRVLVNAWAMARDPRYWEDAESFIPERFEGSSMNFIGDNFQYLPFGGGRRACPGMGFGLAGLRITLANLLFRFEWELPDGMAPEDLDMTEAFGLAAIRKSDLWLIATPKTMQPM